LVVKKKSHSRTYFRLFTLIFKDFIQKIDLSNVYKYKYTPFSNGVETDILHANEIRITEEKTIWQ